MAAEISDGAEITSTWLNALSERSRHQFEGRRLRVRTSATVHEVDWMRGLGGQLFPVPACRVGTTTWDLDAYSPIDESANCARCARNGRGRAARKTLRESPGQLALDFDL